MELSTGRVEANGVEFHYLEAGRGPLVLCLHGFPDNAHTYGELLPALAQAGFRGVAPFMRGYAPTTPAPDRQRLRLPGALVARCLAGVRPHAHHRTSEGDVPPARRGDGGAQLLSAHIPSGEPRPGAPGSPGARQLGSHTCADARVARHQGPARTTGGVRGDG